VLTSSRLETFALGMLLLGACEGTPLPGSGVGSTGRPSDTSNTDSIFDPTTGGLPQPTTTVGPSGDTTSAGTTSSPGTTGPEQTETGETGDSTTGSSATEGTSTGAESSSGGTIDECEPILVEVFYDSASGDNNLEWVRLHNPCDSSRDLAGYSLGWGGVDYIYGTLNLAGVVAPGDCFVVGGPMSTGANGNPSLDMAVDLDPDLQNSGATADGVALFDVVAMDIGGAIPIDAVIYGDANNSGLIDSTGLAPLPHVGDAPSGSALYRTALASTWAIDLPDPGTCPPF